MKKQLSVALIIVLVAIVALLIFDSKNPISERYGEQKNNQIITSGNNSEINNTYVPCRDSNGKVYAQVYSTNACPKPEENNNAPITFKYYTPTGEEISKSDLPTIKVTFPNGGESLTIGTTTHITWESTHQESISNVLIRISQVNDNPGCKNGTADCATLGDIITQSAPNTGSFEWKVANNDRDFSMPAGNYIISIVGITQYTFNSSAGASSSYFPSDSSDTPFTVKASSGY
ncbi:hypothetical protein KW787_04000 [Candidatus Pacearchaeota archaeon]|nr:hypothetical protein [Candidatus Pacearchaeota archaeon]